MDGWPFILGLFLTGEQEGSGEEGEAPENIMFQKSSLFVLRGEREGGGGEGEAPEKIKFQKSCVFVLRCCVCGRYRKEHANGLHYEDHGTRHMRSHKRGRCHKKRDWGAMVDEWISATKATIAIRRKDQPQRLESYG